MIRIRSCAEDSLALSDLTTYYLTLAMSNFKELFFVAFKILIDGIQGRDLVQRDGQGQRNQSGPRQPWL